MQIVIEIDEDDYERIYNAESGLTFYLTTLRLYGAIKNGIVLHNGHGDLIDKDNIIGDIHGVRSITAVLNAPIIIPADKEEINPYEKCKTCGQNRESCCGCPDVLELEQKKRGMKND